MASAQRWVITRSGSLTGRKDRCEDGRVDDDQRWNHNLHYHRVILEALPRPCGRALDVGCGEGTLTRQLRQRVPGVVGFDLDASSVELARRQDPAGDIDYVAGDFLTAEPAVALETVDWGKPHRITAMEVVALVIEADPDDPDCAVVLVDGTIAGRPYRFVLDTGAARTHVVSDEFTMTLPKVGTHTSSAIFGAEQQLLVALEGVSVGPLAASRVDAQLVDRGQPNAQNLLGMDVLKQYCCHFRFGDRTLSVGTTATGTRRRLRTDDVAHPYLDVNWPGASALSAWDSGAGITIVDEGFWQQHVGLFNARGTSIGTDAFGARVDTPTFMMVEAEIGGEVFEPHKVAVVDLSSLNATVDPPVDLILGYTTLRQADWLFDFPDKRWAITGRNGP